MNNYNGKRSKRQEIAEKINQMSLVDWVVDKQYTDLKTSGSQLKGCCPYHTDASPSFFITPSDNTFYCFGCGKGGYGIVGLEVLCQESTWKETVDNLAKELNIDPNNSDYVAPKRERRVINKKDGKEIGLGSFDRDVLLRQMWAKKKLSAEHRQDLMNRGLSPYLIELRNFVTIGGVMTCPITDFDNRFIGYQIKTPKLGAKYTWNSSEHGGSQFKYFDCGDHAELPLNYVSRGANDFSQLFITEGILKGTITNYLFNIPVISCAGNNHASYPYQMKEYLTRSVKERGLKTVTICPDGGFNEGIFKQYEKTYELIQSFDLGIDIQFAWWGQTTKHHPDIDELPNLKTVQYISLNRFQLINEQMRLRQFTPDITILANYLNADILSRELIANGYDLTNISIAIKSGLGSNKTGTILEYLAKFLPNSGVIANTPINALGMQLTSRDLDYSNRQFYHLHEDNALANGKIMLSDEQAKIVNCVNSNHHWNSQDIEDLHSRIVYVDEITSVLENLVEGGTFPNDGVQIQCANSTQRLWGSVAHLMITDGNLTDDIVSTVEKMSGKTFVKVEVIPVNKPQQQITFMPTKEVLLGQFINNCLMEKELRNDPTYCPQKYALTSDNQSELRRVYTKLLKDGLGVKQILIIDKERKSTECPEAFLSNPSQWLCDTVEGDNVIAVIYSPSMNTGYDITRTVKTESGEWLDERIFASQYCLYQGVIGVDSCEQQTFRIRSPKTERFIVAENAINKGKKKFDKATFFAYFGKETFEYLQRETEASLEVLAEVRSKMKDDPLMAHSAQCKRMAEFDQDIKFAFLTLLTLKNIRISHWTSDQVTEEVFETIQSEGEKLKELKKEIEEEREKIRVETTNELNKVLESVRSIPIISRDDTVKELTERGFEKTTATAFNRVEKKLPNLTQSAHLTGHSAMVLIDPNSDILLKLQRLLFLKNGITMTANELMTLKAMSDYWSQHGTLFVPSVRSESKLLKGLHALNIVALVDQFKGVEFMYNNPLICEFLNRSQSPEITKMTGIIRNEKKKEKWSTVFKNLLRPLGLRTIQTRKTCEGFFFMIVPAFYPDHDEYNETLVNQAWGLLEDVFSSMQGMIVANETLMKDLPKVSDLFSDKIDLMPFNKYKTNEISNPDEDVNDLSGMLSSIYEEYHQSRMSRLEFEEMVGFVKSFSYKLIADAMKSIKSLKECWRFWKSEISFA